MNLEYFIARKVAASGQKSFSRLIIRIAIAAIALSMTVMIVATALITGFKNEISTKIFGFWGHIHITDTNIHRSMETIPIDLNQDFYPSLDTLKSVRYLGERKILGFPIGKKEMYTAGGVSHIQMFAHVPGIIKTKTELEGIILKGIGTDFNWDFMKDYLKKGNPISFPDSTASEDIIVSTNTADRLSLQIGDKLLVYFVSPEGNQLTRRFTVCAIFKTGLEEYDKSFAIVDIRRLQKLLGWDEDQVGGFEVFVENIDDLNAINEHIYIEKIPPRLFAQTIRDKLPSIFEWLELQNINEMVILLLMIIVSIINMVTALMILILERTNMIGILKSLGSTDWSVRSIFLYYAAYIIGIGLFWGNLIGIGLCLLQKHFRIIKLSEADYYLSFAPIELNFWTVILLNAMTLIITLFVLIIPTWMVTRITPVKAIRFK